MKKCWVGAVVSVMAVGVAGATAALAADMDSMVTKAPMVAAVAAPPPPPACTGVPDFFLSSCQLSWAGVRVYGTVDLGGTYQTHGTPLDPNHPVGASYLLGNSGTNAVGR